MLFALKGQNHHVYRSPVIIFILGTYLLSPAIIDWWSEGGRAWYRPYLIWLGLIALSYWIAKSKDVDGL